MTEHRIGTQDEWQAERDELLKRRRSSLASATSSPSRRRQLPWVSVEKEYRFETEDGTRSLADLFDGRSQLLVYHFMFGPSYEAGCTVCSSIADTLGASASPEGPRRDAAARSRAPLASCSPTGSGWAGLRVGLDGGSDFNRDIGFVYTEEELKPFLEGDIPATVEQIAAACGTHVAGYVAEGPGLSVYALRTGPSIART